MEPYEKVDLKTLASCMNTLHTEGFKENFMVKEGVIEALEKGKSYSPSEIRILNFYRFEGESDPADNSILYALETKDGVRGLLSDAYGPYADVKVTKFMTEVENIMKKTNPDVKTGN
ncbi:MAG TPA: hypothetical protein VLB84_01370 [Bacteroidia bacterium]|nr:hypothetical protein [Bacteroidia bacterium]